MIETVLAKRKEKHSKIEELYFALKCYLMTPVAALSHSQRVERGKERAGSFGTVTEQNGWPMPGHTGHSWDKEAYV